MPARTSALLVRSVIGGALALLGAVVPAMAVAAAGERMSQFWLLACSALPLVGSAIGSNFGRRPGDARPTLGAFATVVVIGSVVSVLGAYVGFVAVAATWSGLSPLASLIDPSLLPDITFLGRNGQKPHDLSLRAWTRFSAFLAPVLLSMMLARAWERQPGDPPHTRAEEDESTNLQAHATLAIVFLLVGTVLVAVLFSGGKKH